MVESITVLAPLSGENHYWGPYLALEKLFGKQDVIEVEYVSNVNRVNSSITFIDKLLTSIYFAKNCASKGNNNVIVLSHYWYSLIPGLILSVLQYRVFIRITTELPSNIIRRAFLKLVLNMFKKVWILHPDMISRRLIFSRKFFVLPNCSDCSEKISVKNDFHSFGYFGSITSKKGLVELVKAWKKSEIDRSRFRLVIRGVVRCVQTNNHLLDLSSGDASLSYEPLEHMVNRDVGFAGIDTFLFNSEREGFPNVVIEALSLNLPVYARPIPSTISIFKHSPKYLVEGWLNFFDKIEIMPESELLSLDPYMKRQVESYSCSSVFRRFRSMIDE